VRIRVVISQSYAVGVTGKFQKRLCTYGREQVRMSVYY